MIKNENDFLKEVLFPYDKIRHIQDTMIYDVHNALKEKKNLIMHAPTGIGKTVSVVAPCLAYAIKNNLSVFFLTSRHMQHQIVMRTLSEIKNKYNVNFGCIDLIGKKWMCLQPAVQIIGSSDFHQYCRGLREEGKCEFYINARNINGSPTIEAKQAVQEIKVLSPCNVHEIIKIGEKRKLCPYELGIIAGSKADVMITDYHYIFNPSIRQSFLHKISKELSKSIVIVDEGHNLPSRIRELLTHKLSSFMTEHSLKEAKKFELEEAIENITIVNNALLQLECNINEKTIEKDEFIQAIEKQKKYNIVVEQLMQCGEDITLAQKNSFILGISRFMDAWTNDYNGFARILTKYGDKNSLILKLKCLDPSIVSKEIIEGAYCTIMMSGTLVPTLMYKDILDFPVSTIEKEYNNPFPKNNRKIIIIPKTTTKFSKRNKEQFKEIAKICADICTKIKGNAIVFFPSYELMHLIGEYFKAHYFGIIFMERKHLNKAEKENFLEAFKGYKDKGSVLLAVSSGSFGEGIDMPGILKGIIVVGLPLQKPDLETQELINYYQNKFNKGWDYGYVLPAITKCMQNAGRCIRSETDKGIIIFLDERYAWPNYFRCFPKDWDVRVEENYSNLINEFFMR